MGDFFDSSSDAAGVYGCLDGHYSDWLILDKYCRIKRSSSSSISYLMGFVCSSLEAKQVASRWEGDETRK